MVVMAGQSGGYRPTGYERRFEELVKLINSLASHGKCGMTMVYDWALMAQWHAMSFATFTTNSFQDQEGGRVSSASSLELTK